MQCRGAAQNRWLPRTTGAHRNVVPNVVLPAILQSGSRGDMASGHCVRRLVLLVCALLIVATIGCVVGLGGAGLWRVGEAAPNRPCAECSR